MQNSPKDLAGDFNETAKRYVAGDLTSSLLLTKYGLMLKFEAKAPEDRESLVSALCDTALKCLEDRADLNYRGYLGPGDMDSVSALLKTLEMTESAPLLPARAAAALAETGMKFVRRAEKERDSTDRSKLTDYARLCLEHAEKFRAIVEKRSEDVSTSKPIPPLRRIVLKKDGDNNPGL
ncbi:MAG: hypothetical protein EPN97_18555 [Alphaproteobacteria bacterium]|nr:MAG: hypothetical protein EPN97_18555 [Alphaproteobacteria bacterium]